jgi:hypothetical protein
LPTSISDLDVSSTDATDVTISGLKAVAAEGFSSGREPLAESEDIAHGGASRADEFAEAFPGSCRSTGGSNHAAVCNA